MKKKPTRASKMIPALRRLPSEGCQAGGSAADLNSWRPNGCEYVDSLRRVGDQLFELRNYACDEWMNPELDKDFMKSVGKTQRSLTEFEQGIVDAVSQLYGVLKEARADLARIEILKMEGCSG